MGRCSPTLSRHSCLTHVLQNRPGTLNPNRLVLRRVAAVEFQMAAAPWAAIAGDTQVSTPSDQPLTSLDESVEHFLTCDLSELSCRGLPLGGGPGLAAKMLQVTGTETPQSHCMTRELASPCVMAIKIET